MAYRLTPIAPYDSITLPDGIIVHKGGTILEKLPPKNKLPINHLVIEEFDPTLQTLSSEPAVGYVNNSDQELVIKNVRGLFKPKTPRFDLTDEEISTVQQYIGQGILEKVTRPQS